MLSLLSFVNTAHVKIDDGTMGDDRKIGKRMHTKKIVESGKLSLATGALGLRNGYGRVIRNLIIVCRMLDKQNT